MFDGTCSAAASSLIGTEAARDVLLLRSFGGDQILASVRRDPPKRRFSSLLGVRELGGRRGHTLSPDSENGNGVVGGSQRTRRPTAFVL